MLEKTSSYFLLIYSLEAARALLLFEPPITELQLSIPTLPAVPAISKFLFCDLFTLAIMLYSFALANCDF